MRAIFNFSLLLNLQFPVTKLIVRLDSELESNHNSYFFNYRCDVVTQGDL